MKHFYQKMKPSKSHSEKIQCPNCGLKQMAIVEHTFPRPTYIHTCSNKKCGYLIMESEWKKVK